jgi:hypothetical protein
LGGLGKLKRNPTTLSGIQSTTFRLVALPQPTKLPRAPTFGYLMTKLQTLSIEITQKQVKLTLCGS